MSIYSDLLQAFVQDDANTQNGLADKIGRSQAAVNRYAKGLRFPDADTARRIDAATDGRVPFSVWQNEMAARVGLDRAA